MKSSNASPTSYTVATLEDTPRRALELVRGIGGSPAIMRLMSGAGYTLAAHEEGQRLLANVVGFIQEPRAFQTVTSSMHMEATRELVTWNRTVFRRLRAALLRFFPERANALFANLELSSDVDAPLAAKIFLDRVAAIEKQSQSARGDGRALLEMLGERGFGSKEKSRLRKLIDTAQAPAPEVVDVAEEDTTAKREERVGLLRELRAWYDDWAETARTVLVRRDYAIRVGLAHRKPPRRAAVQPVGSP